MQPWHTGDDEYSTLFELLYDQPSQRREYIDSCVKNAKPSWGYIYLVNLIKQNVFNTVFTTNFDDLLNEACYLFSDDVRPIVSAHDSSIKSIRLSSKRPKIVKIHGDFLFDNIKNTVTELETLEKNTKDKFKQYANEFGLIVVGYSGRDRSVMDTLSTLLRFDDNFPNGVYWCVQPGTHVSRSVDALTRFPKFRIVEIAGFDEFFADTQKAMGFELQKELSDPYGSLAKRLNSLIENVKVPSGRSTHPVIEADIRSIGQKISSISSQDAMLIDANTASDITLKVGTGSVKIPLPFELLSQIEARNNHPQEAIHYLIRALTTRPTVAIFQNAFELCRTTNQCERMAELVGILKNAKDVFIEDPSGANDIALVLIHCNLFDLAEEVLNFGMEMSRRSTNGTTANESIFFLNKLQLKRHRGEELKKEEEEELATLLRKGSKLVQWGAAILLQRFDEAELIAKECLEEKLVSRKEMSGWPITKLLLPHLKDPSFLDGPAAQAILDLPLPKVESESAMRAQI